MILSTMADEKRNRMPSNTQKLLTDYHDASKRLEARYKKEMPADEAKESYHEFCLAARELISRCIISGQPRGLCFLISEMEILVRIIGSIDSAAHLDYAYQHLTEFFHDIGAFDA